MPMFVFGAMSAVGLSAVAGASAVRAARAARALYPDPLPTPAIGEEATTHEPQRPTAVVLLDHAGTEVSDFLLPFQLLAASQAFNVYAIAPERRPATLTGGLDVLPHLSLAGTAALPFARPDVVVVPHLPTPDPRSVDWLRQQAASGALVLTVCTGAGVAAAAGLLDHRTATTHWGDIGRLERRFPETRWLRGVRYVDDGDIVASAGITSGIDATLHVIRRLAGPSAMRRAARSVGYAQLGYLDDPEVEPYRFSAADLIVVAHAAFGRRHRMGLMIEHDADEFALAAVMDLFAATFTAQLATATADGRPVRTRHGLTVVPRASITDLDADRPVLPAAVPGVPYAAFPHLLDDLAALGGRSIARFAAKRLELRDVSCTTTTETTNPHTRSLP